MPAKLLKEDEVIELTGLSRMTLFRLRKKQQIGFYLLADGRTIRYSPEHVEKYLKSREQLCRRGYQTARV